MKPNQTPAALARLLSVGGLLAAVGLTGCQSDIGGQVLPSANYQYDDVQFFAPGPEFKLTREANALKQAQDELLGAGP